ncbi:MAG TPA: tetratricopeptide repeat protein, partial [Gemmatimonadales bacterium]
MRNTLVAALLVALPAAVSAQVGRGDSLLSQGDTTGAIAAFEAAVMSNPRDAEAHYRAGVLYLARAVADSNRATQARNQAESHFSAALKAQPDSAKYWLAAAEILRSRSDVFSRARIPHYVDSALALARKKGGTILADAEYRSGVIWWERYEQVSHRHVFIEDATTFDAAQGMGDWNYLETFLSRFVKADSSDPGASMREQAENHLHAALSANPRDVTAAGLLDVLLTEQRRWEEAVAMARRLVRAAPDSGRAWAILGAALTRSNEWGHAQAVFDTAFIKMTSRESAPYFSLGPILKLSDDARWKGMTPGQRSQLYASYWAVAQPLFLNTLNEPRTE